MTDRAALETMADFASGLSLRDLPDAVREKARLCITDVVWGCLHVHTDARAKAAMHALPIDTGGRALVLTTGHRAAAADAAFISAAACAATDRSDTHLGTATHPGIAIIPAVLCALAETPRSGADALRGVIVGYEIMCRIATAIHSPDLAAIFRPTAIAAPIAAAIAVATALGLPRDQIAAAGALATHTAIGFNEWARVGTDEHVFHAGVAARNAVTCALLARAGATAAPTVLEGVSGLLAGHGARDRAAELTRDLGRRFDIMDIVFKPAPACFFAQTPAQAAAQAAARIAPGSAIERVQIRVTQTAAEFPGCAEGRAVASMQAAVMSIPFAVSATLLSGRLRAAAWQDFANPDIVALMRRCEIVVDDALSAAYPGRCGTTLAITLRDGATVDVAQPDFVSMDRDGVIGRLMEDAVPVMGREATLAVLDCIAAIEELGDANAIAELASVPRRHDAVRLAAI